MCVRSMHTPTKRGLTVVKDRQIREITMCISTQDAGTSLGHFGADRGDGKH